MLGSGLVLSGKLPCVPGAISKAQAPSWTLLARSLSPLVARAFPVVGGGVIGFLWLQNGPSDREGPLSAPLLLPSACPFPSCPAWSGHPFPEGGGGHSGARCDLHRLLQDQGWAEDTLSHI